MINFSIFIFLFKLENVMIYIFLFYEVKINVEEEEEDLINYRLFELIFILVYFFYLSKSYGFIKGNFIINLL